MRVEFITHETILHSNQQFLVFCAYIAVARAGVIDSPDFIASKESHVSYEDSYTTDADTLSI